MTSPEEKIGQLKQEIETLKKEVAQKEAVLTKSDKYVLLGKLTAGIAHEINTPLGALRSNNDLFMRCMIKIRQILETADIPAALKEHPKLVTLLDSMDQLNAVNKTASKRIVEIVNGVRTYAREESDEPEEVQINMLIDETIPLIMHQIKNRIEIHRDYGELPKVFCNPNQISQVFLNILVNASQAIAGKGDIYIHTYREGLVVGIDFRDSGKGISPTHLPHIFDPGFTTKGSGTGMGLGLALVKQIIEAHHGQITAESEEGRGATFHIRLPIEKIEDQD